MTWSTPLYYSNSTLELVDVSDSKRTIIEGHKELFVDNGTLRHTQTIHRVSFATTPGKWYSYAVWNGSDFGEVFKFKTPSNGGNVRFYVYGDFGLENPRSFGALLSEAQQGHIDVIVHTGDNFCSVQSELLMLHMQMRSRPSHSPARCANAVRAIGEV